MADQTKSYTLHPSNIETIDAAFLEYVEGLNINCNTINGWEKIPVIWSSAERAFQIKNNKEIRDRNGSLIPPIISIERSSIDKNANEKGGFWGTLSPKDDRYIITKQLNQEKTANFANADSLKKAGQLNFVTSKKNQKIVYQHTSFPVPIYVTIQYKVNIITNYQSQMNEAIQPFMAKTAQNYFLIKKDGHRYECFMEPSFEQDSVSELGEEERKYKSVVSVKVLGYLIGEGSNQEKPYEIKVENAVEIKIPKENLAFIQEEPKKQKEAPSLLRNGAAQVSVAIPIKKTFLIGNGIDSVYSVAHNLSSRDLFIIIRETNPPYSVILSSVTYNDLNNLSIDLGTTAANNAYTVTVIG